MKRDEKGEAGKPRRSPRRLGFEQVFEELVSLPDLLAQPNFELEVVTIKMDARNAETWIMAYRGAVQRKRKTHAA